MRTQLICTPVRTASAAPSQETTTNKCTSQLADERSLERSATRAGIWVRLEVSEQASPGPLYRVASTSQRASLAQLAAMPVARPDALCQCATKRLTVTGCTRRQAVGASLFKPRAQLLPRCYRVSIRMLSISDILLRLRKHRALTLTNSAALAKQAWLARLCTRRTTSCACSQAVVSTGKSVEICISSRHCRKGWPSTDSAAAPDSNTCHACNYEQARPVIFRGHS